MSNQDDNSLTGKDLKVLILAAAMTMLGIMGFVNEIRYLLSSKTTTLQIQRLEPFVPSNVEDESRARRQYVDAIFDVPDGEGGTTEDSIRFAADDERLVASQNAEMPTVNVNFIPGAVGMLRIDGEHNWVSCVFVVLMSLFSFSIYRFVLPEARKYAASERRQQSKK